MPRQCERLEEKLREVPIVLGDGQQVQNEVGFGHMGSAKA